MSEGENNPEEAGQDGTVREEEQECKVIFSYLKFAEVSFDYIRLYLQRRKKAMVVLFPPWASYGQSAPVSRFL